MYVKLKRHVRNVPRRREEFVSGRADTVLHFVCVTGSPMSLYDFYMYLKYIEYSAENLEFYMW